MEREHEVRGSDRVDGAGSGEHPQLRREREAQERLLRLGASELAPRPWRPGPMPPTAVDLTQFAVWRSADLEPDDLLQSLALLPAARDEVEGVEVGLVFSARSAGLTWAQIAGAMGFRSPQACQQHITRLSTRRGAQS